MAERHRTVLMVDKEAILLLVLANELDQVGISLIPGTSVKQARSMLAKTKPALDALIINCRVPGACSFAAEIVQRNTNLEVIGLVSEIHQCTSCRHLLAVCAPDPEFRDVQWVNGMVNLIKKRLAQKRKVIPIRRSP